MGIFEKEHFQVFKFGTGKWYKRGKIKIGKRTRLIGEFHKLKQQMPYLSNRMLWQIVYKKKKYIKIKKGDTK